MTNGAVVDKRPVKLVSNFIRHVKHISTDEGFPYPYISTYLTIAGYRLELDWNKIKNDKGKMQEFIKELRKQVRDCEEKGFLHNSKGNNQ